MDLEALKSIRISDEEIDYLKNIGFLYEDSDNPDEIKYYIPEIYRYAINLSYSKGARPRVLVIQRKVMKSSN